MKSIFEEAGKVIPFNLRSAKINEIFKSEGLDWQVNQKTIYSDNGIIPKFVANYRDDNKQFLGFASTDRYKVVQNIDAFDFIDGLTGFTFEKIGVSPDSKKVWVVGKTAEQIDIDGSGDFVDFYVTFLHGHDGKSGIRFIVTPIRMFCMNQLNLILSTANFKFTMAHTGNIIAKIQKVQNAINKVGIYRDALQTELVLQTTIKMSDTTFENNLEKLFHTEKELTKIQIARRDEAMENIRDLYNNKPDLQNYRNTGFAFVNAVSDFVSHRTPNRVTGTFINNEFLRLLEGSDLIQKAKELVAV